MIAESKMSTVHDEFDMTFSDEFKRAFKNARELIIEKELSMIDEEDIFLVLIQDKESHVYDLLSKHFPPITIISIRQSLLDWVNTANKATEQSKEERKQMNIPLSKGAERLLKITMLERKLCKFHNINSITYLLVLLREKERSLGRFLEQYYNMTYDGVREIVKEHYSHLCSEENSVYIRGKVPESLKETFDKEQDKIMAFATLLSMFNKRNGFTMSDFITMNNWYSIREIDDNGLTEEDKVKIDNAFKTIVG